MDSSAAADPDRVLRWVLIYFGVSSLGFMGPESASKLGILEWGRCSSDCSCRALGRSKRSSGSTRNADGNALLDTDGRAGTPECSGLRWLSG